MKQVKVLMLALVMLIGVGFTSCMNSDNDYTPQWMGPVEVKSLYGSTYFKIGELEIYPTAASLMTIEQTQKFDPASTKMAYISCNYSNDEASGNAGATNKLKNVTLTYAVSLDETVKETAKKGDDNDSISTAPIIKIDNVMVSSSASDKEDLYILNNRYLFVGISYFVREKAHTFTLMKYKEDIVDEGTIKFYLRHRGTAESNTETQTSAALAGYYPYLYYKSFDLIDYLPTVAGKEVKIVVAADLNSSNNKLDDAEKKEYSVTYKVEE